MSNEQQGVDDATINILCELLELWKYTQQIEVDSCNS